MKRFARAARPALVALAVVLAPAAASGAGEIHREVPVEMDPARHYLFYLHGAWIERHGLGQPHPRHGPYRFADIAAAFAARGFVVIAEARLRETEPPRYAEGIADQVRHLLSRGVAPENITIAGHSKGGMITLATATLLRAPTINFVVMAGCGREGSSFRRGYERFIARRAAALQGHILSLYDRADREAGSCRQALERAIRVDGREITFSTGLGHGLFYAPRDLWLDAVVSWVGVRPME